MDAPCGNSLLCTSIEICQADENPSVLHMRTCPTDGTTGFLLTNRILKVDSSPDGLRPERNLKCDHVYLAIYTEFVRILAN